MRTRTLTTPPVPVASARGVRCPTTAHRTTTLAGAALLALCTFSVFCTFFTGPAMAGEQPTLVERTERYFRYLEIGDRVQRLGLLEPHWLADGNRFWYAAGAPEETVIHLVDPVANTRVELFDTGRVRAALEDHLGHPPPHRGLPFDDFTFVGEGEGAVRFTVDGTEYRLELDGYTLQPLGQPGPYGFSPSKRFFLLYSSTPTEPDVMELRRADGTLLQTLAHDDVDGLAEELHWRPPEKLVVKAADGKTDLHQAPPAVLPRGADPLPGRASGAGAWRGERRRVRGTVNRSERCIRAWRWVT